MEYSVRKKIIDNLIKEFSNKLKKSKDINTKLVLLDVITDLKKQSIKLEEYGDTNE